MRLPNLIFDPHNQLLTLILNLAIPKYPNHAMGVVVLNDLSAYLHFSGAKMK